MRYVLLQDLHLLNLDPPPKPRRFLGTDLMLVREPELIAHLVDEIFQSAMSKAHAEAAKKCAAHLCILNEYQQPDMDHDLAMAIALTNMPIGELFLEALWLVKDNGADSGPAYIVTLGNNGHAHHIFQPHSGVNSTAGCLKPSTAFSEAELDQVFKYFELMFDLAPKAPHKDGDPRPSARMYPSRLGRALYVVQAARNTTDVGMKIAHYCICLESLFSTDSHGVSHRVAERAARFLGTTGEEQQAIYKNVKGLYDVRSSVVHGSRLSPKKDAAIRNLAVIGDDYLRRTLVKMIESPDLRKRFSTGKDEALNAYFLDQLFPKN